MGATVIKVENPKTGGDDTRSWGPNYALGTDGQPTDLSAYFMAANRNKQSIAIDLTTEGGQDTIRQLAARADVVIENYKPDGLVKYGLDHATLCAARIREASAHHTPTRPSRQRANRAASKL